MKINEVTNKKTHTQSIQLVRYSYNSETKRTDKQIVAQFKRHERPNDEILERLDDEEKEQLEAYFEARREKAKEQANKAAIRLLPGEINGAVKAIRDGQGSVLLASDHYIENLLDSLDELKKELRKAGVKITRGPQKSKKTGATPSNSEKTEEQGGLGF